MSKEQRKLERTIAVETYILLATLTRDYGIEFSAAVQGVEAALHRAYWGELQAGYRCAIVTVAPAAPKLGKVLRTVLDVCAATERGIGYRKSGDHDTWDSYPDGEHDKAMDIEEIITETLGDFDAS